MQKQASGKSHFPQVIISQELFPRAEIAIFVTHTFSISSEMNKSGSVFEFL